MDTYIHTYIYNEYTLFLAPSKMILSTSGLSSFPFPSCFPSFPSLPPRGAPPCATDFEFLRLESDGGVSVGDSAVAPSPPPVLDASPPPVLGVSGPLAIELPI